MPLIPPPLAPSSHAPTTAPTPEPPWRKAISPARDRQQSRLLTLLLGGTILLAVLAGQGAQLATHRLSLAAILLSVAFGLLAWRLRAATAPAAAMGAAICLLLAQPATPRPATSIVLQSSSLHALVALFVLTFLATRFRRATKEHSGLAEPRRGRRAAQVLANLGAAALFAAAGHPLAALGSLAEATADTISSEIGQALGGPTWLLTTGRPVPPGTDGGISLRGTLAGTLAALFIAAIAAVTLRPPALALIVFAAGCIGLVVDSLLGATLERRGWIGNDLVNLLSTVAAGVAAMLLAHLAAALAAPHHA